MLRQQIEFSHKPCNSVSIGLKNVDQSTKTLENENH